MKYFLIRISLSIIPLLYFLSCHTYQGEKEPDNEFISVRIDPTKTNSIRELTELVLDIELVPIETNSENLFDMCRRIILLDDQLLILTGHFEVHSYNLDGTFNFKIAKEGKGKNEIFWINDISPGTDQSFYILGYLEFYEFDYYGNFINIYKIKLPYEGYNPTQFHIVNNGIQLYSSSVSKERIGIERFSIAAYDPLKNRHKFALYMPTCNVGDNTFMQCDSILIIAPVIGVDTIYYLNSNSISPLFYIDFGKHQAIREEIPQDYISPQPAFSYAQRERKCLHVHNTFMNNEYLMFSYLFHTNYYRAVYNISKKEALIIKLNRGSDNLLLMTGILAVVNNKFVTSIPAYKIAELVDNDRLDLSFLPKKRQNEILNQLENVQETDNPVLMLIEMKSNLHNE